MSFALLWAGGESFAFPVLAQTPPSVTRDVMPDLAAVIDASVAIALAWAFVRVVVRSDRFERRFMLNPAPSGRSPSRFRSLDRTGANDQS